MKTEHSKRGGVFVFIINLTLLAWSGNSFGQGASALPDDPEKAWGEVQKLHEALRPPISWRTNAPNAAAVASFAKQVRESAFLFADKSREFINRFPTNENVRDARISVVYALSHAVAAGDTNAQKQIEAYVAGILADKDIPEDDRVGVFLYAGNVAVMKKAGMRFFTEGRSKLGEEFETGFVDVMRAALQRFPTNSGLYTMLVSVAQRSKEERKKQLAKEVLNAPKAPAGAKTLAEHILKGTLPYQIGRPIELSFTALDGRKVDLADLKGKVVLVQFWSTDCGPCVGEMPEIKAVYHELHPEGFELIAISLDEKEGALRRFIKEKELPWPQFFDAKGWENKYAVKYGIFSIPTLWLIDKRGNLRDTQARSGLQQRIKMLLAEKID